MTARQFAKCRNWANNQHNTNTNGGHVPPFFFYVLRVFVFVVGGGGVLVCACVAFIFDLRRFFVFMVLFVNRAHFVA